MILGIALPESVRGDLATALADLPYTPQAVALFARGMRLDVSKVRYIHVREQALIYATTHGMTPTGILEGIHDRAIDDLAWNVKNWLPDAIIRLLHEANGREFPWSRWTPEQVIAVFNYVATRIYAIAPAARMAYCPIHRGRQNVDDYARYYPGPLARVLAFDYYVTNPWFSLRPRRVRMAMGQAVKALRELDPDADIWMLEFGIARGLPRRRRLLVEALRFRRLAGLVYMDMDIEFKGKEHRWSMGGLMRRVWRRFSR